MANNQMYDRVKDLLYDLTGITLGESKDVMIDNRLQKLVRDTKFEGSVDELLEHIKHGEYVTDFINSFTTNKTNFFREVFHFEDMRDRVIPELSKKQGELKVYCSASSTGEEPYSIVMTVMQTVKDLRLNNFNFSLISTDIDTEVLRKAKEGIYTFLPHKNDFPNWIQPQNYFKKREIEHSDEILIKAKDSLRVFMKFDQMNLMSPSYPFSDHQFDIVFCRNVLIYFNNKDQNAILKKLFKTLKIGGTLYLGHSENPLELHSYVERIGHNIFIKLKDYA